MLESRRDSHTPDVRDYQARRPRMVLRGCVLLRRHHYWLRVLVTRTPSLDSESAGEFRLTVRRWGEAMDVTPIYAS